MATKDNPDYDHNLVTDLEPAIKAKITEYRLACEDFAIIGTKDPEEREGIMMTLKIRRYNLERCILTYIKKARKEGTK